MQRTDCRETTCGETTCGETTCGETTCGETTSPPGTAPGVPGALLTAAWGEFAARGAAACVLYPHHGALTLAWVNRALSELLIVAPGELTGRTVRELADHDPGMPPRGGPLAVGLPAPSPPGDATGAPVDVAVPPVDVAVPPVDVAVPPVDVAVPPVDVAVPPVDVARLSNWALTVHRLARGAGGFDVARAVRADGSLVPVRVRVSPVRMTGTRAAPAEPDAWLAVLDPMDAGPSAAEAALGVAEHRFAALAGCAPIGILASDAGMRLGYVNDRFVTLLGRPDHALLGTGWLDAVHRDDLPTLYDAVGTVLGGTPVELAVRVVRPDDRPCWLQLRLAPTTTPARAAAFIGTAEDVTERRTWEEHVTYQAQHDPLTGLVNRRRLIDVLTELLGSRRAGDRDLAVLFLDLDGFKEVNDTHGHEAGDKALVEVARRMRRVVRESDVLSRVSGDEFVVVLRRILGEAEAAAAARRYLAALGAPVQLGPLELGLSASIGVALPSGNDTPESLLRAADRAMYEAKAAGPGHFRMAGHPGEAR